jgi:hypothetical protein
VADDAAPQIAVEEIQGIEDALDALLTLAKEDADHRAATRPDQGSVYKIWTIAELIDYSTKASKAEQLATEIVKDPIGRVCRLGIRALGERLFEIGGTQAMEDTLDRVAERRDWGWRMSVCDARWDAIGRTSTNPGWCA